MFGVCIYWDGGRPRFGQIEALLEVAGGWCFRGASDVVFSEAGWHKLSGVQGESVPRLDSHLAVIAFLSEDAEACATFVLGFFSGYETGVRLTFPLQRLVPSAN